MKSYAKIKIKLNIRTSVLLVKITGTLLGLFGWTISKKMSSLIEDISWFQLESMMNEERYFEMEG